MNALIFVDIEQGIHKGKSKEVAQNEKKKKILCNIANFEVFPWNISLRSKLFFLKSGRP